MANAIKMPQLSDTMSSGKILGWKKREGDRVARGDILAEVETDKANLEIEAFQAGVLLKIEVPEGAVAQVGQIIAHIGEPGEAVVSSDAPAVAEATTPIAPQVAAPQTPPPQSPPLKAPASPTPTPQIRPQAAPPLRSVPTPQPATTAIHASAPANSEAARVKASPLARRLASDRNLDLSRIQGTGPDGRIIRRDLESVTSGQLAPKNEPLSVAAAVPLAVPTEGLTPLTKMRETIARRMQESVREIPHFYSTTSIRMDQVKNLRAKLKDHPDYQGLSINHFVIKAAAYALEREPRINSAFRDNGVYQPSQINIGIITALPDGLLIPVVKDANRLAFRDLVTESRALVDRARSGRPTSTDLSGGTFSISNMGMLDIENFTAIVNPGQGAILAVSAIKEEPVVQQGQMVIGQVMRVTLSVDHRIIDGVMAGTFLQFFKEALEAPALLFA